MEELLLKLKELDVRISVASNNLKLSIPEKVDEALFLDDIREYKQELIDYLQTHTEEKRQFVRIPKSDNLSEIVLTPSQERMYVFQEMAKDSIAYNIPLAIEMEGVVDKEKLEKSFIELIHRHEILRTCFILDEHYKPVQKILENFNFELGYFQSSEEDIKGVINTFSQPFQLEKAPLLRANLIALAVNKFVLLIDIHHIVTDGISCQIFIKDLMSLYSGAKLPDLHLQYGDYANWYYSHENQENLGKQRTFWLQELEGFEKSIALPSDYNRPKQVSFEGSSVSFKIDKTRKVILDKICKNTESSLFTVLIAIFGVLQAKLTGSDDIVIGVPVAGRRHSDLKQIIGMFVNTLPIRIHPKSKNSFTEYLQNIRSMTLKCFDNQEFPYEKIIENLELNKENDGNPLFNTLISLNNIDQTASKVRNLQVKLLDFEKTTSKFDLIFHIGENEDELNCSFEYNTQIFKKKSIDRLVKYVTTLIDQIGENENITLGEISLLDEAAKEKLLKVNDFTTTKFPEEETLVTLFEKQVSKTPNNIGLSLGNESLTYAELNKKANQIARLLRSKGVGKENIVGLFMDKTMEAVAGMLGILKAGGAYLPIDITYPKQRVDYILKNSEVKLVLTSKDHNASFDKQNISLLYFEEVMSVDDTSNLECVNSSEDLCYVLYTSGTTGNPKGVMIEHSNVVRLLFNDEFQFDFGESDVWTMFHSHCFDFSVWELYGALLNGGKLIIIPPETTRDPEAYAQIVRENGVTILNQTPTAFYNLMAEAKKEHLEFPRVRYVIFGGEMLSPYRLKDWIDSNPNSKLINMYGITETSVHTTFKEIGATEISQNISNLGKALPTASVYLLNDDFQPVPNGVVGEMYIGGQGVGRGYLNNEELSRSRFIKNPFEENGRLYRTGDLAVLRDNHELEYKGRSDHQVQLKGFRIELGEVEYHLQDNDIIENAVVTVKQDDKNQPLLCAYYVSDKELTIEYLRGYLQERLPLYMIPTYFMKIEKIPYTSNNKIAIDQLPNPAITELSNYVAPTTEQQKKMTVIWAEHLGVNTIGITDSFFALGGDSIKAIGLVSKINDTLNVSVTIADLYVHQTIVGLSHYLKNAQVKTDYISTAKEIIEKFNKNYHKKAKYKDTYEAVYPMNGIEKGMVFHSLKGKTMEENESLDSIVYHEQLSFQIPSKNFDFSIFERTIELLVEKHPVFRKIFDLENEAHIILKTIAPEVDYIDASYLSDNEMTSFIKQKREEEIKKRTGLSFSLLWRMTAVKFNSCHYLFFDFHHSLLDGWSLQSFISELNDVYNNLVEDYSFKPVPLDVTYFDQILYETAATLDEDNRTFWEKEFNGYERLELPKTEAKHEHKTHQHSLGAEYKIPLEKVALKYKTSVKHLCFAAFVYAMKMISYKDDITVGITTNNRPVKTGGEKLLGCFLNTLPIRANIPSGITWGEYINYIDSKLKQLKKYDSMPLYKVVDIIGDITNDQNPMFDVFFNYVDFHVMEDLVAQVSDWGELDNDNFMVTNNLIEMHFDAFQDKLDLWITYSTTVIDETISARLAEYVKNVLKAFIENEENPVCQNAILSNEEKQCLNSFNNLTGDYDLEKTVLDLFKEQVIKTPKAIALVFEEEFMSYEDLDAISNKWASFLIENGARKGKIISLLMERSLDMIVAMLAVLKSGAAYLPIDPDQPQSRTRFMLEESESIFVIANLNKLPSEIADSCRLIEVAALNELDCVRNAFSLPASNDLAYVIYTSGSTGLSKGVMVKHKSITNFILYECSDLGIDETDKILQFSPYYFDVSVQQIWLSLTTGARLVLVRKEVLADANVFISYLDSQKITMLNVTPSFLERLELPTLDNLKRIVVSGEECKIDLARKYVHKYDFYNEYGPTEATIISLKDKITSEKLKKNRISIGKPVANTRAYVLDESMNLLPIGSVGELYLSGVNVVEGYLNRPDLTKERFIENPYGSDLLYKTGDMAMWNRDGSMDYKGRKDEQLKFNGIRIEPGEIECHLKTIEGIMDSIVMVKEIDGSKYFIAYYLSKYNVSEDVIREHLLNRLPISIIPTHFLCIDSFPMTRNGKLDKKSFPLPDLKRKKFLAPVTEMEKKMVLIWSRLLNLEPDTISIDDTFFELGGNSLNAIALTNTILKTFSIEISIKEVFIKQTIKRITNYMATVQQFNVVEENQLTNAKLIL